MKTHIRVIFIWTVGLALLWGFLFVRNGNIAPLGVVVVQAAQVQEFVFDDEMPTFEADRQEGASTGRDAMLAPQNTAQTTKNAQQKAPRTTGNAVSEVNINTAGLNELMKLPGIGPAMAQRIIDYRNENGNFVKTEDIKKVRGIGEARFNSMKDLLRL
jgi:comEA protein